MTGVASLCRAALSALLVAGASPVAAQPVFPSPGVPEEESLPLPLPAPPGAEAPTTEGEIAPPEAQALDLPTLYERLAISAENEWPPLQQQIMAAWARSESPSMTLLLSRATRAMEAGEHERALLYLDDLVRLAPDFAEGWNRRATVYFLLGRYGHSVADIQRTLALEPRHFGALAGLGIILDRLGQDDQALAVFRRALEIHPHLEGAIQAVERLAPDVDGRPL